MKLSNIINFVKAGYTPAEIAGMENADAVSQLLQEGIKKEDVPAYLELLKDDPEPPKEPEKDTLKPPQEDPDPDPTDYKEKYQEILSITGLESKVKSYPSQLSGGQQQRVAIARAVLGEPEIILADEATGNLDAASGAEIMQLFRRLNEEKGVTILQVTHSAECASYSSRIVKLRNRVIEG